MLVLAQFKFMYNLLPIAWQTLIYMVIEFIIPLFNIIFGFQKFDSVIRMIMSIIIDLGAWLATIINYFVLSREYCYYWRICISLDI